ncbi:hypothetical protein [Ornithinimicrobium murale]|uniref:hypothetical protein n=1 Tax=Ornithinimicrobium murale TaxID=1050153 RepID=UPI000E0D349A|nr:hypothetical protein [Ornithinimicrobium murale]
MLNVTSTVPAYIGLANLDPSERVDAWVSQYEMAHADIFEVYYSAYGNRSGREAAAGLVADFAPGVVEREAWVHTALKAAAEDLAAHGLMDADQSLDVVLMVGTGHSDAWVKIIHGIPVLFVALEMLQDPERDALLVLHELIHVVHVRALLPLLATQPALEDHVGMRVWLEGLAVAGTRLLRPGRPDTDYLFAAEGRWVQECQAALPALAATLVPNLTAPDAAIGYSLCGVTDEHPWPSRAGYWVGDQVVRELLEAGHDLPSLMPWGPDGVAQAFRESRILLPYAR